MATVGGLSLGPARADEAESSYQSVVDASSTSDDDAASFGGGSPSVGATSADAPPTAAPADDPWEGSYVKPAMTVPQYMEEIEKNRAAAFATLTTLAESLKFSQLDNELLIAPFDDVKQAAFYLPWALVKLDEDAGVKTQRRWLTFRERLIRLDAVAVDAARYQADEEEVLFAIAELESALDELLSDVPARLAR